MSTAYNNRNTLITICNSDDQTESDNSIFGFVIFFIVILIVIIVVFLIYFKQVENHSQIITTDDAKLGEECSRTQKCGMNLRCFTAVGSSLGVCLRENGQACNRNNECVPPNKCLGLSNTNQGVCAARPVGGLNQPSRSSNPPCNIGLVPNSNGVCKLAEDSLGCSVDGQDINSNCITGVCSENICDVPRTLGEKCYPGQCTDGLQCSREQNTTDGFCQPDGVMSGQRGAYCLTEAQPGCNPGLSCDANNMCQPGTEGFLQPCDNVDGLCRAPYICGPDEVCQYPEQPNSCSQTGSCSHGYGCRDGRCIGTHGTMCTRDDQCFSLNCNLNQAAIFTSSVTNDNNEGWTQMTLLPHGVKFDRFIVLQNNRIWGLDPAKSGGLYLLVETNQWIRVKPSVIKTVTYHEEDHHKIRVVNTVRLITISTSGQIPYILIEDRTVKYHHDCEEVSATWSILEIVVNSDNTVDLIPAVNVESMTTVDGVELVNVVDMSWNSFGDVVIIANINLELEESCNFIYSKPCDDTRFTKVDVDRDILTFGQVRFYRLDNSSQNFRNIAYTPGDDRLDQALFFTGDLSNLAYPNDHNQRYSIPDFAVSLSQLGSIQNMGKIEFVERAYLSYNLLGISDPNQTSYRFLWPIEDINESSVWTEFRYPGYNTNITRLFIGESTIYTMSDGICS